jgi:hypothetical protein
MQQLSGSAVPIMGANSLREFLTGKENGESTEP